MLLANYSPLVNMMGMMGGMMKGKGKGMMKGKTGASGVLRRHWAVYKSVCDLQNIFVGLRRSLAICFHGVSIWTYHK